MSGQRVCSPSDVPDGVALRVEVRTPAGDTVAVAVARDSDGGLHAVSDVCSHQDVSLSEGEVEDCSIECWLHGSRFDLRTGQPTGLPAIRPIPVYRLSVVDDDVYVDVSAGTGTTTDAATNPAVLEES